MANFLATNAAWLGEQLQTYGGIDCLYLHPSATLQVVLTPSSRAVAIRSKDLLQDQDVSCRGDDFIATAADLVNDHDVVYPVAGMELQFTDENSDQATSIVFPRVGGRCFNFEDPGHRIMRIYAIPASEFTTLKVNLANYTTAAEVLAIPGLVRGAEDFTTSRNEARVLTTTAYVAANSLPEVTTPPPAATFDFLGLEGWAIDMNRTEWGRGLLKIGLMRETLVREWQARRNATV